MIELHRRTDDTYADELEQKLQDLVVAYRTESYSSDSSGPADLPFIKESGKVVSGRKNIERYLIDLEKELQWQRSLSGDGCYIDPDSGEVC
jgi:hypothetical protein